MELDAPALVRGILRQHGLADPVGVLRRKLRTDAGQQPAMSEAVPLRSFKAR